MVGENSNGGTITACYSTGAVTGGDGTGGVAGNNNGGEVIACYSTGEVNGTIAGGVVGQNYGGTVTACYWSGTADSYDDEYDNHGIGLDNTTGYSTNANANPVTGSDTWTNIANTMNDAIPDDCPYQWDLSGLHLVPKS